MDSKYKPIDCGWYDHLELAAVRKEKVKLQLLDGEIVKGVISDLFIKKGEGEFLIFSNGYELRLDKIDLLNGNKMENTCSI